MSGEKPSFNKGRKFLVGGNWKMNGYRTLVDSLTGTTLANLPTAYYVDVVICPPYPYLPLLLSAVHKMEDARIQVGAQNIHHERTGAYTGEVSFPMLNDIGVDWTIIGHSECRQLQGETDEIISKKFNLVIHEAHSMRIILCVGETLEERGEGKMEEVLLRQLNALLPKDRPLTDEEKLIWSVRVVIAYEPVWAIGTGKVATPEQAQQAHALIRKWVAEGVDPVAAQEIRIIYGGSISAGNCRELAQQPDVDGFLVGGASLKSEFRDIVLARH